MSLAGIWVDPNFEHIAHPPQQITHKTEYQNHFALKGTSMDVPLSQMNSQVYTPRDPTLLHSRRRIRQVSNLEQER